MKPQSACRFAYALAAALLLLSGCVQEELRTEHGQSSGVGGGSVNGLGVLANMLEQADWKVSAWMMLSPKLERADVIVWAPDDFEAPSEDVQYWLDNWLYEPGKTLVYIGRDYDAAPAYWAEAVKLAPAESKAWYGDKELQAINEQNAQTPTKLSNEEAPGWFRLDPTQPEARVSKLGGPWARGVDAKQASIWRRTRLIPVTENLGEEVSIKPLLTDGGGDSLVVEATIPTREGATPARMIFIENGSFLVNAALVNKENRKLSARLIERLGTPGRVVFLESGRGGPSIHDQDPTPTPPSGLALLGVWPIGATLAQLGLLGLVVAMVRWPILGVPRRLPAESLTDFSEHVSALGRLLAATKDRSYAYSLIQKFRHKLSDTPNSPPAAPPGPPNQPA